MYFLDLLTIIVVSNRLLVAIQVYTLQQGRTCLQRPISIVAQILHICCHVFLVISYPKDFFGEVAEIKFDIALI